MTHRFPVKEIALQSGLSTATVDRVLNNRAHVSPQTRRRVEDAVEELILQEGQLAARGRRVFIDVLVETPKRFSREIQRASEAVLSEFKPIALRPRFHVFETLSPQDCALELERIGRRGSQGVCLKARDTGLVRAAINALTDRGIPVVTVFTDNPGSRRLAYAGLNNIRAGQTAAYLMHNWLPDDAEAVLTTLSQHSFRGEEHRYEGFSKQLRALRPSIQLLDASGGGGHNPATGKEVAEQVITQRRIDGVYSMGGGNRAILTALDDMDIRPSTFIAHDLDEDNLELLAQSRLSVVLYHDLKCDMRAAFRQCLAFHGLAEAPSQLESDIQIVTPMNLPADYA
ncbi:LacI family DNA-binding transcriptional regulator [Roseibium alexandrii]|uniref:LacI family DNA-binding transcriptional regulator n=1 Tax=Roseibium alexandrii TaxID=388408 RepID=UPI0037532668